MVTQQILVLLFQVRILVAQLKKDAPVRKHPFLFFTRNGVQMRRLPPPLSARFWRGLANEPFPVHFRRKARFGIRTAKSESVSLFEKEAIIFHETRNKQADRLQYTRNQNISKG